MKTPRRYVIVLGIVGALLWGSAPSASAASAAYYYRDCYVKVSNNERRAYTTGTCSSRKARHQYSYQGGQTHWTHYIHSFDGMSPDFPIVIQSQHKWLAGGVTHEVSLWR